jgi:hypothetical protein
VPKAYSKVLFAFVKIVSLKINVYAHEWQWPFCLRVVFEKKMLDPFSFHTLVFQYYSGLEELPYDSNENPYLM